MKFLCDRCKTRYSIGDDRVRGKILKIRCKNCANVITVREGMTDADAADASGARNRSRPTTAAPPAQFSSPAASGALTAAFSAQMAKPPPALEEEWYVSIDGDQSGPFSLAAAQRWVGNKAFDAELHCWSEGFDDWLPVDKVSHFRNLRKKPSPAPAPPPLPRAPAAAARPIVPRDEETPKPLFAATMATLEKGSGAVQLPPLGTPSTLKGPGAPAVSAPAAALKTNGSAKSPAIPAVSPRVDSARGAVSSGSPSSKSGRAAVSASPGAKALAAAFDVHEDPADSMTAVEAPMFNDDVETRAEPVSARRGGNSGPDAAVTVPSMPAPSLIAKSKGLPTPDPFKAPITKPYAAPPRHTRDFDDDLSNGAPNPEDSLDIGEVSRVVNLADLAKQVQPKPARQSRPAIANLRGTGATPKLDPAALALTSNDPSAAPIGEAAPGESMVVQAPVQQDHRRGMFMLLGVAGVLLLGVVGAVVLIVTSGDDDTIGMGLGKTAYIDTSRPEDIARHTGTPEATGSGDRKQPPIRHPWIPQYRVPDQHTEPEVPTDPTKKALDAVEVEDMARKQGDGTNRCYMRAQKGALGIEIGDLKKIMVTMTVDREGIVADVQLSDHAADSFGKCLVARIKSWKFRTSPGGIYKFALAFTPT